MKKINYITSLFLFVILASQSIAQGLISVQNGGQPKFFQQVDDAITNSANGDTIYIPGGSWYIAVPINKRLHIIGVGHHPDSTKVTFPTTLIGQIYLATGANNGSLVGIYFKGGIDGREGDVSSMTIERCRISDGLSVSSTNRNFSFVENIINGTIYDSGAGATNFSFFNNIFWCSFYSNGNTPFINSTFKNNIFYSPPRIQYSLFENNVFLNGGVPNNDANSTLKNNLFANGANFPTNTTNVYSKNIVGQEQTDIFMKSDGATIYENDYHLQSTCPGKNAGTDGTDVGIYGGIYPWKEGSIPANPHFQSLKVGPTTDASGNLNVKIKVAAQEH